MAIKSHNFLEKDCNSCKIITIFDVVPGRHFIYDNVNGKAMEIPDGNKS